MLTCTAWALSPRLLRAAISIPADNVPTAVRTSRCSRPEWVDICALCSSVTCAARPSFTVRAKSRGMETTAYTSTARSARSASAALVKCWVICTPGVASSMRTSWRDRLEWSSSTTPTARWRGRPAEKIHHKSATPSSGTQVTMARSHGSAARRRASRRKLLTIEFIATCAYSISAGGTFSDRFSIALHSRRGIRNRRGPARAAEQGPPRSEGCVPLPATHSVARAGGSAEGAQGGVAFQFTSTVIPGRAPSMGVAGRARTSNVRASKPWPARVARQVAKSGSVAV